MINLAELGVMQSNFGQVKTTTLGAAAGEDTGTFADSLSALLAGQINETGGITVSPDLSSGNAESENLDAVINEAEIPEENIEMSEAKSDAVIPVIPFIYTPEPVRFIEPVNSITVDFEPVENKLINNKPEIKTKIENPIKNLSEMFEKQEPDIAKTGQKEMDNPDAKPVSIQGSGINEPEISESKIKAVIEHFNHKDIHKQAEPVSRDKEEISPDVNKVMKSEGQDGKTTGGEFDDAFFNENNFNAPPDEIKPHKNIDISGKNALIEPFKELNQIENEPVSQEPASVNLIPEDVQKGIFEDIVKGIRFTEEDGIIKIKLYPEDMGELNIELSMDEEKVNVHMTAENGDVANLLETDKAELIKMLGDAGVEVKDLVIDDSLWQRKEQYRKEPDNRNGQRPSQRRQYKEKAGYYTKEIQLSGVNITA